MPPQPVPPLLPPLFFRLTFVQGTCQVLPQESQLSGQQDDDSQQEAVGGRDPDDEDKKGHQLEIAKQEVGRLLILIKRKPSKAGEAGSVCKKKSGQHSL